MDLEDQQDQEDLVLFLEDQEDQQGTPDGEPPAAAESTRVLDEPVVSELAEGQAASLRMRLAPLVPQPTRKALELLLTVVVAMVAIPSMLQRGGHH